MCASLIALTFPALLSAQTNPATPDVSKRPVIVTPGNPGNNSKPDSTPPRPAQPGKPANATEMQKLVNDFQNARATYIQQQQELNRKLSTATEEQRTLIREQIKESLREFRELQKQQARELREQAQEIKRNTPNLRDVIDHGGGDGRGR